MSELETKPLEITQYNPVKAEIEKLRELNTKLVFQYDKPADNKSARSHIQKMRVKKADVERVRVEAKKDALEYGRKVDAIAKELTADLESMIDVHQKPLDEIQAKIDVTAKAEADRIEAERLEAERIEREKQEAILAAERAEAKRVADQLAELQRKQEIERLQREAAENARLEAERKAKAEQEASAARERAAVEAQARAERERQEAIIAADRAKIEAERKAIEAEKLAIRQAAEANERAEQEKLSAVKRATEDAERRQREAAAAVERKRIAEQQAEAKRLKQKKVRNAIIEEIAASILENLPKIMSDTAHDVAALILDGKVARVSVNTVEAELVEA